MGESRLIIRRALFCARTCRPMSIIEAQRCLIIHDENLPTHICGNETGDIYKGETQLEAEHFWTTAVNDSSHCETKDSVRIEAFCHIKLMQHISSVTSEGCSW